MDSIEAPGIETCEKRFLFIDDETVRFNLALETQYISYLDEAEKQTRTLDSYVGYAMCKDIIIHIAALVEGALFFILKRYQEEGGIDFTQFNYDCFKNQRLGSPLSNIDESIICYREEFNFELQGNMGFQNFNTLAKKAGIWNKELNQKADAVRKARNDIHLTDRTVDPLYTREDLNELYSKATELLNRLEECRHEGFAKQPPVMST